MTRQLEVALLVRLLETGELKAGVRSQGFIGRFNNAGWIELTSRRSVWEMREGAAGSVRKRLEALAPTWQADCDFLRSISRDPFDPKNIEALPMLRRQPIISRPLVNRRNWNAASGLGPKHRARLPPSATLTKDWAVRFRPNNGLVAETKTGKIDLSQIAEAITECIIPERAWRQVTTIGGQLPRLAITCENLGAYIDLVVDGSTLVIFSPGTDVEPAVELLKLIPGVAWIHFGDIDQKGVNICQMLARRLNREQFFWIPSFAMDYLEAARQPRSDWDTCTFADPAIEQLRKMNKALFQETFMLDSRLTLDMSAVIHSD